MRIKSWHSALAAAFPLRKAVRVASRHISARGDANK